MTKTKTFIIVAVLLVCVSVFGAWTNELDYEIRYADASLMSARASETVTYTRKEVSDAVTTAGGCPLYHGTSSDLTNACGAVAGAEIVAYYDKYFPNMIPNWMSYYEKSGKYRVQDATYVPALTRELYTLMRTNVDDVGVSRTDFLNGLTSYVNGKGYQINYQSVKSGNKLNYDQCKNAINNNKVVVLFAKPTQVYTVNQGSYQDNIVATNIASAHIMVAYGYIEYKYYNSNGLFRTDLYLMAAVGKSILSTAYYRVDSADTEAAYIVNIQ